MIPLGILAATPRGGPPPGPVVTFNPADKAPNIVLSDGNIVAGISTGVAYQSVRATHPLLPGRCCEFYIASAATANFCVVGVSTLADSLNNYAGSSPNGFGYYQETGNRLNNGEGGVYGPAWVSGDRIGMARIANGLYFWRNGVASGLAFELPAGVDYYPVVSLYHPSHVMGLRAKASHMSQLYGGCAPMGS